LSLVCVGKNVQLIAVLLPHQLYRDTFGDVKLSDYVRGIPDYWAKSENMKCALMLAADIFDARR